MPDGVELVEYLVPIVFQNHLPFSRSLCSAHPCVSKAPYSQSAYNVLELLTSKQALSHDG